MSTTIMKFIKTEAGGGMLLVAAAAAAVAVANSSLAQGYFDALKTPLTLNLGFWQVEATLKDWVKDGLMAIFFYVIGLELKRELTVGELSDPRTVLLPVAGALGGALTPVAIYALLAGGIDMRGWPVPVATDIAFALAALAILAPKIDPRVRLYLLTLAVVDDLLAILLIAVLYTGSPVLAPLLIALALLGAVAWLARSRDLPLWLYPAIALVTWGLAKESGVHTSVMAVAAAMVVPPRPAAQNQTILGRLEHYIHPVSAGVVLPVFAFCAAGVSFAGLSIDQFTGGVTAAIALALFLGKPAGVTAFTLVAAWVTRTRLPFAPLDLLSVGCLCGIGFTMSLFIAGLAFGGDDTSESAARLGVLVGSGLSLMGAVVVFLLRSGRSVGQSRGA